MIKKKITRKDLICNAKIVLDGKNIETKVLIDTGNMLREPITNTEVMVIEHTLLYGIVPKEILNHLEEIIGGELEKIPEKIRNKYVSRLKLIPFSSLGKQNGMLIGIKADYIEIEKNGEKDESEKEKIKKENKILKIRNKK